ncbi:MAG: alpha/beta hydrolase [Deltaproteobacteria bacterium]|nr:alpha/beta hydrolase [Deltaproteobacteria bacterium]
MPNHQIDHFLMHYELGDCPLDGAVLFIHGNLASNHWWHPLISEWQKLVPDKKGGKAILAEWRGNGKSSAPQKLSELHPKRLALDYIHLVQALGFKKVHVVGHSTGGSIALYAALEAPQLFDKIVLLDSVGSRGIAFDKSMYDAFTQMSKDRNFCASIIAMTIKGVDTQSPLFQQLVDDAFHIAPINWHAVPDTLKKIDISNRLRDISHPVLVLHGEDDSILPLADSKELAEHLPNGQFMLLNGHGHSTNIENPAKLAKIINDFL